MKRTSKSQRVLGGRGVSARRPVLGSRQAGWLTVALVVALLGVLLATAARGSTASLARGVASAAGSGPMQVVGVPAQAARRGMLVLSGSGAPAHGSGTAWLGAVRLGRFTVGRRGNWTLAVRLPARVRAGVTHLQVSIGARTAAAAFLVTPASRPSAGALAILSTGQAVRVLATQVPAGSALPVQAVGLRPHSRVTISLGRVHLGAWRASRRGALQLTVGVPRSVPPGSYTLVVVSAGRRLTLGLRVTPAPPFKTTKPGGGGTPPSPAPTVAAPSIASIPDRTAVAGEPLVAVVPSTRGQVSGFSAAGLPPGISIDSATGTISGTPGWGGSYRTTVTASGPGGTASTSFTLTVAVLAPLIAAIPAQTAPRDQPIMPIVLSTAGTITGVSATGLPPGITINSTSGTISGTPRLAGYYTTTVTLTGPGGSASTSFSWDVAAPPTIGSLPSQSTAVDAPVTRIQPTMSGQIDGISASGLPSGVSIDPTTGTITGAAGATGTNRVTVTVSGPGGSNSTSFTWTVTDPVIDAVGDMGCAYNDPNYNSGVGEPSAPTGQHQCLQNYVGKLVAARTPSALLDLGDTQYDTGTLFDFQHVFANTFGVANSVTYPVPGNEDLDASFPSSGFVQYFNTTNWAARVAAHGGDTSHLSSSGYYSFNIGTWHIVALNSNCTGSFSLYPVAGGCGGGSPEEQWLQADLAHNTRSCILAYWHHPLFDSGGLATESFVQPFWQDLYAAHATLILNGHGNHHYERLEPVRPDGVPNANGITEFIASTGGQSHGWPQTNSSITKVANYVTFGILKLTLHAKSYDWRFVPAAKDGEPSTFTDSGSGTCQ